MLFIASHYNPYAGKDFIDFTLIFFSRIKERLSGALPIKELASDELQLLILLIVASSSAMIGTFLVLRKSTMLANSLSHTILLGIIIAFITVRAFSSFQLEHSHMELNLKVMLIAAFFSGIVTTFATEFLTKSCTPTEDASIGLTFSFLFALGITLATLFTKNAHIGIEVVMGNVDGLHQSDLYPITLIFAVNALLIGVFFKEYKITTFDPVFSRTLGLSTVFFNYLLMIQLSATAVAAFRAVGVLMVLIFLVIPPLLARMFTKSLFHMLTLASLIGMCASFIGVGLSRHVLTTYFVPLSTGGLVALTVVMLYICALVTKWILLKFQDHDVEAKERNLV